MMLSISNSVQSTILFSIIFFSVLFFFFRPQKDKFLSLSVTQELKGLAILAIIFSHIGYFLISDHSFLFPLSILAGVGVNLFLFLSGYGLTMSALKKDETIIQFYKKRVLKIFVPFWIVLVTFLTLDFFVLHISYPKESILKAFFGIFTQADIYHDVNSPFWYLTLILGYYILFPLVFSKKHTWISALGLYLVPLFLLSSNIEIFKDVEKLHRVHLLAFPLGVFIAWFFSQQRIGENSLGKRILRSIQEFYLKYKTIGYYLVVAVLLYVIGYTAIHSGVGVSLKIEQTMSLITMYAVILLFIIKKYKYKLLSIFGLYSYEIYLFHWPILYRYDIFYAYTPAWLATLLYLVLFVGLAWILKKVSSGILQILYK